MVNGFRERWKASALSTALTIYLCQIRVHQRWQSKLPTSYSSEEGVAAGHRGQFTPCGYLSTLIHTNLVGLERATFRSLVDCWSDALQPPTHPLPVGQWFLTKSRRVLRAVRCVQEILHAALSRLLCTGPFNWTLVSGICTQGRRSWGAGPPQYFAEEAMHQSGPSNN